jgi:hypothetical protein
VFSVDIISDAYQRVEPRIHYGGSGNVIAEHIRIAERLAEGPQL